MNHSRVPGFKYSAPAVTPVAPAAASEPNRESSASSLSESHGRMGMAITPQGSPASRSLETSLSRARGPGVPGSIGLGQLFVRHGERDPDAHRHLRSGMLQQRNVTGQQRPLGQDGQRRAGIGQRTDDAGHQPVPALRALVGVGVGAKGHVLPVPGGLGQLLAQHLGGVDLDHHLAVEVQPGVEVQVGVALAGEAVDARVAAAAVGVDGPLERHPGTGGHLVEHRFGGDLMKGDPGELGGGHRPHQAGQGQQRLRSPGILCPVPV